MHSSYLTHNYVAVFKAMISAYQPINCVELGVLEGYSALAIASGLKENFDKHGAKGHLVAYDLFEEYPYRHVSYETTKKNIDDAGLSDWVTLYQEDAFRAHSFHGPNTVHFLHVDLSNTGDTVKKIMEFWDNLMVQGGIICFEGGSEERDQIEWMTQYKAEPIKKELETNSIIEARYVFATYFKFPSLTCLLKKR